MQNNLKTVNIFTFFRFTHAVLYIPNDVDKNLLFIHTLKTFSVKFFWQQRRMCIKIDKEFEELFLQCHKITNSNEREMKKILDPLKVHLWKQQLKKYLKIFSIFVAIWCAIYYVDTFNWYFCAVGRIVLINLLPLWDWKPLTTVLCLLPKVENAMKTSGFSLKPLNEKDCRACENFGKLST